MVVFECARCGTCCLQHIGTMMNHVHGLMILPSERKLFSEEIIEPMFRYSMDYGPDPGRVFMYQIAMEPCPHYAREEKACRIYSKRPVVCQTFPFEIRGGGLAIHEFCPEIAKLTKDYEAKNIHCPESYVSIGGKLRRHWEIWMKTAKIERYDLKERKWYFILDGVKPEHLGLD